MRVASAGGGNEAFAGAFDDFEGFLEGLGVAVAGDVGPVGVGGRLIE